MLREYTFGRPTTPQKHSNIKFIPRKQHICKHIYQTDLLTTLYNKSCMQYEYQNPFFISQSRKLILNSKRKKSNWHEKKRKIIKVAQTHTHNHTHEHYWRCCEKVFIVTGFPFLEYKIIMLKNDAISNKNRRIPFSIVQYHKKTMRWSMAILNTGSSTSFDLYGNSIFLFCIE